MGETFVIPRAKIQERTQNIPGTDGQKMSKSKNNTINIFLSEKKLRKQIMSIQTDSTPMEAPKDPAKCNVFAIYSLVAPDSSSEELRAQYKAGGMGYGQAKLQLFEFILEHFAKERKFYDYLYQNPDEVYIALAKGAEKARKVAREVILRVRDKAGY